MSRGSMHGWGRGENGTNDSRNGERERKGGERKQGGGERTLTLINVPTSSI